MNAKVKARLEQFRQARAIHGGTVNMCAAAIGIKLSRMPIPSRKIREQVFRTIYGNKYTALCEEELEQPLGDYKSINALFTRGLSVEHRPLSHSTSDLLCPCDGTVQDVGSLKHDTLLTAKGIRYTLQNLAPGVDSEVYANGQYCVIFLSPADCHRVFCPQAAQLQEITHIPGRRLLVHPPFQRPEFPVFSLNERVILTLETALGPCLLILVAGWGVGNITYPFAARCKLSSRKRFFKPAYKTKRIKPHRRVRMRRKDISHASFEEPLSFSQGQWLATFELGSTAIMLTPGNRDLKSLLVRDQKVKYGEPAFTLDANAMMASRRLPDCSRELPSLP